MSDRPASDPAPSPELTEYVEQHAPELDPSDVAAFLAEHDPPADEREDPRGWAVRVLRERAEGEHGDGLSVDRVVGEIRDRRRRGDA